MKIKKLVSLVAILLSFAIVAFTLSPKAATFLDKNGSITLRVTDSGTDTPLKNVAFRLYFVARAYESGNKIRYELIPPYDESKIGIDDLQDASLPIHLAYFAESRSLPYTEKSTDENGNLVFENLTPGLYLIVPAQEIEGCYMPSPFVVSVPEYDTVNKTWVFEVDASPKIIGGIVDGDKDTYISVVKKWKTDKEIPEKITVVLLRDFKEFAKIELNEENNWHYRWDGLSKDFIWSVVESQVPDGYEVYYETSSNTVTIINEDDDFEEPSTEPGTQPGTEPGTDEPTTKPTGPSGTTEPGDDLIHTGQLNWPVPVFAISGLLLFSIGWAILNLGKKESE